MSEKIYNMVDLETIEKLADIVAAKELGEITIADGEKYITVKGKKCPPPMPLAGAPVAASPGSFRCCSGSSGRNTGSFPEARRQVDQGSAGRHFLCGSLSGSAAVCTGGRYREKGRRGADH